MPELIRAKESTLAELLRSGRFSVPMHQRYYDWEEHHVQTLLDDLADAVKDTKTAKDGDYCHFLGSIMLIKNNGQQSWEINDGQQRIITFSLICAYLSKKFDGRGYSQGVSSIFRVLFDVQEGSHAAFDNVDDLVPRVTPPRSNKTNFNNLIRGHEVGRNGKMVLAWKCIDCFFSKPEHQGHDWQKEVLEFLLTKIVVIKLEVDKSLDANSIFETLNYRGKQLDQVDLVKNYFLSFFSNSKALARCTTVEENFDKVYDSFSYKGTPEYVRCYMQAEHGFIKKERFFRGTKQIFGRAGNDNPKAGKVFNLVGGLAKDENIQIFKTFSNKSSNQEVLQQLTSIARKGGHKRKIDRYLFDMKEYTITRPVVFALLRCYQSNPQNRSSARFVYDGVKVLASFVQRSAHVGDFKPSNYEENFANLAVQISKGACNTVEEFRSYLEKYDAAGITKDNNYIAQMESKFYQSSSVTKSGYILRSIAEHKEDGINVTDSETSIEHVLPKSKKHNIKPAWSLIFDSTECEQLVHCWGNLTVMGKQENSAKEVDNESFAAKKKIYKKSAYKMTRDLCDIKEWNPKIVKKRQHELAKIAAKQIWKFYF